MTEPNRSGVACSHCSRRDVGTVTACDGEGRAADHARLIGGQKRDHRGDVLGFWPWNTKRLGVTRLGFSGQLVEVDLTAAL